MKEKSWKKKKKGKLVKDRAKKKQTQSKTHQGDNYKAKFK